LSERERLFNRHSCDLITFASMGMKFTASVSRHPDGRIGEVFIDNHKQGSAVGTLGRDPATTLSFAVQHSADIEAIRCALCRQSHGRPLGPLAVAFDLLRQGELPP
jgi:hypothetical protein